MIRGRIDLGMQAADGISAAGTAAVDTAAVDTAAVDIAAVDTAWLVPRHRLPLRTCSA